MNRLFLSLLALLTFAVFNAHSQKKVVAVMPFLSSTPENKQSAAALQSIALQVFNAKSNIKVVDRSADESVLKELDNQIREQSMSSKVLVPQGQLSGSQEIIIGILNSVSVEPKDGKFVASLNYTLEAADAATGVMINSHNFKGSTNSQDLGKKVLGLGILGSKANALGDASTVLMADTKEAAITNAINDTRRQMTRWINEVYPPDIKVLAVDSRDSKGYPVTLSMAGFEAGVPTGKTITVNEITYLENGSGPKLKRVKKIAELKIVEIQGEVTECKVKSGEDVLDEKMKGNAKLEFYIK